MRGWTRTVCSIQNQVEITECGYYFDCGYLFFDIFVQCDIIGKANHLQLYIGICMCIGKLMKMLETNLFWLRFADIALLAFSCMSIVCNEM